MFSSSQSQFANPFSQSSTASSMSSNNLFASPSSQQLQQQNFFVPNTLIQTQQDNEQNQMFSLSISQLTHLMNDSEKMQVYQRAETILEEIKLQNRDYVQRIFLDQFSATMNDYVVRKLKQRYYVNTSEQLPAHMEREQRQIFPEYPKFRSFNIRDWDLNELIYFFKHNFERVFKIDFKNTDNFSTGQDLRFKINQIMFEIKLIRNKRAHQKEFSAENLYDGIQKLREFFLLVVPYQNNFFSEQREAYLSELATIRLQSLEIMNKEEQCLQIMRILKTPVCTDIGYEFSGNIEFDRYLIGIDAQVSRDHLLKEVPQQLLQEQKQNTSLNVSPYQLRDSTQNTSSVENGNNLASSFGPNITGFFK